MGLELLGSAHLDEVFLKWAPGRGGTRQERASQRGVAASAANRSLGIGTVKKTMTFERAVAAVYICMVR